MKAYFAIAVLLSTLSLAINAQENTATTTSAEKPAEKVETLYIVEMIFFTHNNKSAKTEEQWPTDIQLSLPEPQAYLVKDGLETIFPDALTAEQKEDITNKLSLSDSLAEDAINDDNNDSGSVNEAEKNDEKKAELAITPASPLPLLDASHYAMNDAARAFKGLARYRFLEHIAFAQRISPIDSAPHIIIHHQNRDEGKQALDLSGSIQLYKGRFLHLKTDLWLKLLQSEQAENSHNLAAEASDIDALLLEADSLDELLSPTTINEPLWPTPPMIHPIENLEDLNAYNLEREQNAQAAILDALSDDADLIGDTSPEENAAQHLEQSQASNAINTEDAITKALSSEQATALTENPSQVAAALSTELIATLQQKRKMRSFTRHYIDHPLMGILIEIRPFPMPEKSEESLEAAATE